MKFCRGGCPGWPQGRPLCGGRGLKLKGRIIGGNINHVAPCAGGVG